MKVKNYMDVSVLAVKEIKPGGLLDKHNADFPAGAIETHDVFIALLLCFHCFANSN